MAHARERGSRGARRRGRGPRDLPAENDPPPRRPRTGSRGGGGVDLRLDAGIRPDQRRLHLVAPTAYILVLVVSLAAGLAAGFAACFLADFLVPFLAGFALDVSAAGACPCIGDGCCATTIDRKSTRLNSSHIP